MLGRRCSDCFIWCFIVDIFDAIQIFNDNVLILGKFLVIEQSISRNMDVQMLLEACKSGDVDVVDRILTREPTLVQCSDTEGRLSTPLHFAAGYNRLEICKILVSKFHANVGACDRASLQPLHNAASYGHLKVANFLIKSGADINSQVGH